MGYGIWDMGYGIWDMGYGIWDMTFKLTLITTSLSRCFLYLKKLISDFHVKLSKAKDLMIALPSLE